MVPSDRNKLNRLEELKSRLFSKNYKTKIEHRDRFSHSKTDEVPDSWGEENNEKGSDSREKFFMKTSIFKNLFFFSVVFFILTLGYASYVFFFGGNTVSSENINISVLGNNFVAGGEELSLVIEIANKNNAAIDLVDLVLEYPKGSSAQNGDIELLSTPTERMRVSLGTIPAGSVRNENVKLTLFGEQGSIRPIKISVEYRVEGSNAIFVKDKPFEVTINSTPINISVDAPDTISPNQDITLNVKVGVNSTRAVPKLLLRVEYPVGFSFKSASPAPSINNNIWNLGDIPAGGESGVTIVGKMIDVFDGESKNFQVSSGSQSSSNKSSIDVVLNSLAHVVTIKKPFVEAKLSINGDSGGTYSTYAKSQITGEIRWTNNLNTKLNDLEIKAKIYGNALDSRSINAEQGFYNSGSDTITWDKNYLNDLREVNPGETGTVRFTMSSVSLYSAGDGILPNPSINVDVSISGKELAENYASKDLTDVESSVVHITSDLGFAAKAFYYSGPFTNKGSIPPKVEKETTYTITWSLSNTANNVSKSAIRATLPQWMKFVGPFEPKSEDLIYNPSTKEITWNIGNIPKGTGITTNARSVSFQVALTPSTSQIGSAPVIIKDAILTGHDDFANVDLKVTKSSLTTNLSSDTLFPAGGGSVVP